MDTKFKIIKRENPHPTTDGWIERWDIIDKYHRVVAASYNENDAKFIVDCITEHSADYYNP